MFRRCIIVERYIILKFLIECMLITWTRYFFMSAKEKDKNSYKVDISIKIISNKSLFLLNGMLLVVN